MDHVASFSEDQELVHLQSIVRHNASEAYLQPLHSRGRSRESDENPVFRWISRDSRLFRTGPLAAGKKVDENGFDRVVSM